MFLLDDRLCWSASDLTRAAECEYAVLRTLDVKLGWADPIEAVADPLQEHIARLGDRHEERLLAEREAAGPVVKLGRADVPYTQAALEALGEATYAAFAAQPEVVFQAGFFDGEFLGYADFIERTDAGWIVCDAKLARHAKPQALLQLGAYADQLDQLDLPVAPIVSLLLGNGERVDFAVADILPVFRERRGRLRRLFAEHRAEGEAVQWADDRYVACGKCAECAHAAEAAKDVILVAGLRMDQRLNMRAAEPIAITTIADLADAATKPDGITQATFAKLQAQARLQWAQLSTPGAPTMYELTPTAAKTLALLPAPSPGDLFFDFEGDPLYDEGDPTRLGLEYLWGVMDTSEKFAPLWAHSSDEERSAFVEFMDLVAAVRTQNPDMHIYHYAPYETAALKRLASRYQTKEKELDDLLRSEVFVDLYATVRGSIRASATSYSIKKLEPLYMGAELRESEVQAGDASIVAYHDYRSLRATEPHTAQKQLDELEDYNRYDCLSTLRLRDWLLARAEEAGVADQIKPRILDIQGEELSEHDPVFVALMARSGPIDRTQRTPEEQAYAMLATGIDYYRREHKQFWWGHFDRLAHPVDDWAGTRDVFVVESSRLVGDWALPTPGSRNPRRTLRLRGDWAPGSKPGSSFCVVYERPSPPGVDGPEGAPYGSGGLDKIEYDEADPRVVLLTESRKPSETFTDMPVALTPSAPPGAKDIAAAIKEVAATAASSAAYPDLAVLDLLARRPPRLGSGGALPTGGKTQEDVVAALVSMDDSYIAIQGPPGTGKTYTGSRVIKSLVEKQRWRIGVVGQSHAVVENLLNGIVDAGLDPELVAKNSIDQSDPQFTTLKDGVPARAKFLEDHRQTGCVLGGTAWTFANENLIERGGLDLLVVDEAGQFALAPTIGSSMSTKRLLLLGDPQQLPQVSQGTHAEPVDESALGWLMDGADTIPAELGYFLGESYRMHPALCEKISTLSYAGRLHSAASASGRHLAGVEPGLRVIELDHVGNRTESPPEALAVVEQVTQHLGAHWSSAGAERPLGQTDFLVVAPYNAQVNLIRTALDKVGLTGVRVGTVDKFQGREAPVTIISMTASSHGDVPRGMGFLLSRNRVNVAGSRAQWATILIRSSALTAYMPSSAHGVLELGAFIGLCTPDKEQTHE